MKELIRSLTLAAVFSLCINPTLALARTWTVSGLALNSALGGFHCQTGGPCGGTSTLEEVTLACCNGAKHMASQNYNCAPGSETDEHFGECITTHSSVNGVGMPSVDCQVKLFMTCSDTGSASAPAAPALNGNWIPDPETEGGAEITAHMRITISGQTVAVGGHHEYVSPDCGSPNGSITTYDQSGSGQVQADGVVLFRTHLVHYQNVCGSPYSVETNTDFRLTLDNDGSHLSGSERIVGHNGSSSVSFVRN